jgi:LysM repeat protein
MTKFIRITILLFWLLFFSTVQLIAQTTTAYSWMRDSINSIQFHHPKELQSLLNAWNHSKDSTLVVLHLGDSHLQNENLPNKTRTLMQAVHGDAGIGLIQPFSIVKTYDARFYKGSHTGTWNYAKSYSLPPKYKLGVRGMTAHTTDQKATFKIKFNKEVSPANNQLLVWFDAEGGAVPVFTADSKPVKIVSEGKGWIQYAIDAPFSEIDFKLQCDSSGRAISFTLYGMSLSNVRPGGCIWHNAGVGACQYKSVLYEDYFEDQAAMLQPDLVIMEYGTNDFLYNNSVPETLEKEIRGVIEKVRKAAPYASIILVSVQDMTYKGKSTTAARTFTELLARIAGSEACAFYDWYSVSGGKSSMKKWGPASLTQNDGIHLNGKGSELKAEWMISAIQRTVQVLNSGTPINQLLLPITEPALAEVKEELNPKPDLATANNKKQDKKKTVALNKTGKYHVVKSGETLSHLAAKYKTKVSTIKKLNNLSSDRIRIGQKLRIR